MGRVIKLSVLTDEAHHLTDSHPQLLFDPTAFGSTSLFVHSALTMVFFAPCALNLSSVAQGWLGQYW